MNKKAKNTLMNDNIKASKVRVISEDGKDLGTLPIAEALNIASGAGLDLVQLSETDGLPITKIMDFGKNLYTKKKKLAESKKKQKVIKIKEVRLRPKIGGHDYLTKINRAIKFLNDGNKVKISLVFRRGREASRKNELGGALLQKIDQSFTDAGLETIAHEKDAISATFWSRVYYLKSK